MKNSKLTRLLSITWAFIMTFFFSVLSVTAEEIIKVNRDGSQCHMTLDANGQWQLKSITKTTKEGKTLTYDMSKNQLKQAEPTVSPSPAAKSQ